MYQPLFITFLYYKLFQVIASLISAISLLYVSTETKLFNCVSRFVTFVEIVPILSSKEVTAVLSALLFNKVSKPATLDGTTEYEAIVKNQIDFEDIDRSGFKSFVIQFLCNPIAHDIDETVVNVSSTPTSITINQTFNTYPIIELKGSGDVSITFNNETFYLYGLNIANTYILDCNAKEITSGGLNQSNLMSGDFPYLKPSSNTISYTGTITQFKIKYKKAYL